MRYISEGVIEIHGVVTNIYHIWRGMRGRCNNPRDVSYLAYGGRGISVCPRWSKFMIFREDMGERPSLDLSIERVDNNGNYEPSNCKWGTRNEQARNTRSAVRVVLDGVEMPLAEAVGIIGVPYYTAISQINRGNPFNRKPNYVRRLDRNEAGEIRWLLDQGIPMNRIAQEYGCCYSEVRKIKLGLDWASAEFVPVLKTLPPYVSPLLVKYLVEMEDWVPASAIKASVGMLPQGLLSRMVRDGVALKNAELNLYKASPEIDKVLKKLVSEKLP